MVDLICLLVLLFSLIPVVPRAKRHCGVGAKGRGPVFPLLVLFWNRVVY